jgi:CheY-like chemotaxis protein
VFTLPPRTGTAGAYSPWPTMESELSRNSPKRFSRLSSVCIATMSTQAAGLDWPFANGWWSSTADGSGFTNLRLAEDQRSASPSPEDDKRPESTTPGIAPQVAQIVLLVEDNSTDVFVIRKVLAEYDPNLQVRVARDGQEALGCLREMAASGSAACPALVLLDLNIPKIAGLEVLRELRSASRCNLTPVIIVTSSGAEADRVAAQALRADGYFKKPASVAAYTELREVIRKVLDTDKQRTES